MSDRRRSRKSGTGRACAAVRLLRAGLLVLWAFLCVQVSFVDAEADPLTSLLFNRKETGSYVREHTEEELTELLAVDLFERDYRRVLYSSEDGLEGSAANCIFSDSEGLLWIGCYTGLFRYDSREFRLYEIEDYTVSVNCIAEEEGSLWVGTNGNGIYRFDGTGFTAVPYEGGLLSQTVRRMKNSPDGGIYAATRSGLIQVDCAGEEPEIKLIVGTEGLDLRDFLVCGDGSLMLVTRPGRVYRLQGGTCEEVVLRGSGEKHTIRCIAEAEHGRLYLGTAESEVLLAEVDGEVLAECSSEQLENINEIRPCRDGAYWVCSDRGIGRLAEDELAALNLPFNKSVESMCIDYQGNFWFASSKTGILELSEMPFSDLGAYLGISESVNSILPYGGKLFIGTDNGLLCYDRKNQRTAEMLSVACRGERVRHLFEDSEGALWVSTGRKGLLRYDRDGWISRCDTERTALTTNGMRFVTELGDGTLLAGSEEGVFRLYREEYAGEGDESGHPRFQAERYLAGSAALADDRILSIEEDEDGRIYIGTDGDGLYIAEGGEVTGHLSTRDGFRSNVIMRVVYSEKLCGLWVVTGAGLTFLDGGGTVRPISSIPAADCLDLVDMGDGELTVLAGNGMFCMGEEDLLAGGEYDYVVYDREYGLPVDFTANADNCLIGDVLYLCGTAGAAAFNITKEQPERELRLYMRELTADGEPVVPSDDGAALPMEVYRLNIDMELLNYSRQKYQASYQMVGADREKTVLDAKRIGPVSYTNLKGGEYRYRFQVLDPYTGEAVADRELVLVKQRSFWEERHTRMLFFALLLVGLMVPVLLAVIGRDRYLERDYRKRLQEQKNEELRRLAFRDPATGVGSRSLYEQDKEHLKLKDVTAMVMISLNHAQYLRNKKGLIYVEDRLRDIVDVIRRVTAEEVQIYRVSDFVFCYYCRQPVHIDQYIQSLRNGFAARCADDAEEPDIAIGAVYANHVLEEDYRMFFERCDNMRRMDQRRGETRFMERKISFLSEKE